MSRLIFIYSLPRSGSTLLQRELVANTEDLETSNETWVFLALFGNAIERNVSTYSSKIACRGIEPHLENWAKATKSMFTRNGVVSFLEKTPRNYLIFDELVSMYPDDLHIVLTRDLDKVFLSMKRHFGNGSLKNFHKYHNDLKFGTRIIDRISRHPGVVSINYEGIKTFVATFASEHGFQPAKNRREVLLRADGLGDPRAMLDDGVKIVARKESCSVIEKLFLRFCYNIQLKQASTTFSVWRNLTDFFYVSRSLLIIYAKVDLLFKDGIYRGWHRD